MTTEVRERAQARAITGAESDISRGRVVFGHPLTVHVAVVLGYTLLTVVLTYPIAWNLSTEVPGGGDAWQHIWNLWWVKEALLNRHTNPYHTDLLYYPYGANLYLHTLVLTAGLMGIPLQLAGFNLIATYNMILLVSFVLAGYGMYLLCYYLTGNRWASFTGGLVFTFSPYHLAHLFGHMNLASLQWIPFYVLALLKAVEGGKAPSRLRQIGYAAGAGALLALNAYTDWVYATFLALFTGMLLVWKLLVPSERHALAEAGINWREGAVRMAVGLGVFVLLTSPILWPTLAEARQGYAQQAPLETLVYSSDLVLAFTPSELHPMWGGAIRRFVEQTGPYLPMKNPSERVVFVGYTVLVVAGYAVWRLWRDRRARFWGFMAVVTWVLSLGPVLQVLGRTTFTAFGVSVPLPYLLLYKLPLFSIMRTPARLTVLTMLALGVLVALGLAVLLSGGLSRAGQARQAWKPRFLLPALIVPTLVLGEFVAVPFPMVPPGWGVPVYSQIAKEPGRFALLELPLRPFGDYMAYQTVHGKPIIGGYLSRQPPYPLPQEVPVVRYLLNTTPLDDPARELIANGQGVQSLRALGVKYIIIRWWAFTEQEKAAMRVKLDLLLGRPPDYTYPQDMVDVWQIMP